MQLYIVNVVGQHWEEKSTLMNVKKTKIKSLEPCLWALKGLQYTHYMTR